LANIPAVLERNVALQYRATPRSDQSAGLFWTYLLQTHEAELRKRILTKQVVFGGLGGSALGILASRLVIKPLMHMAGDPPWLIYAVVVGLLALLAGVFAVAIWLRLRDRRPDRIQL
jgi:hypothetical protein